MNLPPYTHLRFDTLLHGVSIITVKKTPQVLPLFQSSELEKEIGKTLHQLHLILRREKKDAPFDLSTNEFVKEKKVGGSPAFQWVFSKDLAQQPRIK